MINNCGKRLLALDTTASACTVLVSQNAKNFITTSLRIERGTAEVVFPLIEKGLKKANTNLDQVEGFMVCTGPGNFTSLRIAISAMRGLAISCRKPCIGINLFDILSMHIRPSIAVIKGPRDKVYSQEFIEAQEPQPPKMISLEEFKFGSYSKNHIILGDYAKEIAETIGCRFGEVRDSVKRQNFIDLGYNRLKQKNPRPAPLYVRQFVS